MTALVASGRASARELAGHSSDSDAFDSDQAAATGRGGAASSSSPARPAAGAEAAAGAARLSIAARMRGSVRRATPPAPPAPAGPPPVRAHVKRHGQDQVEIKLFFDPVWLAERKAHVRIKTISPRSLGIVSSDIFYSNLWRLSRFGFDAVSLDDVLDDLNRVKTNLLSNLTQAIKRSARKDTAVLGPCAPHIHASSDSLAEVGGDDDDEEEDEDGVPRPDDADDNDFDSGGSDSGEDEDAKDARRRRSKSQRKMSRRSESGKSRRASAADRDERASDFERKHDDEESNDFDDNDPGRHDIEMPNFALSTELTRRLGSFEQSLRVLGCMLKSAIRKEASTQRPHETVVRLERTVEEIECLRNEVIDASRNVYDRVAVNLLDKLEEFVLLAVQQTTSRIALRIGESHDDYRSICKLGAHAQSLLADRSYPSGAVSNAHRSGTVGEEYLLRWRTLKYYFFSSLYLAEASRKHSLVWADLVGMSFAALAMIVAIFIMWAAEINMGKYTTELFIAMTFGYILKDRIKEWGKRYIVPLVNYPDRMSRLTVRRYRDKDIVVGRCNDWISVKERGSTSQVEYNLRRHKRAQRASEVDNEARNLIVNGADSHDPGPENEFELRRELTLDNTAWSRAAAANANAHPEGNHPALIQVIRINLQGICQRIGPQMERYTYIDRDTGSPRQFNCPEMHQLRLHVQISWTHTDPKAVKLLRRASGSKTKHTAMLDQRYFILLDADGLRELSRRL